jgi:FdhE protein
MKDIKDEDEKTFLSVLIRKYFQLLREKNKNVVPEKWAKGNCPFCSTHPRIAFDSEQARTLFCPLCGNSWEFQRIRCAFCDNMDHTMLGYFEAESSNGVRVSFCKKCKHYIKVFDIKMRTTSDADTEDVLTLELNAIASREGFKDIT